MENTVLQSDLTKLNQSSSKFLHGMRNQPFNTSSKEKTKWVNNFIKPMYTTRAQYWRNTMLKSIDTRELANRIVFNTTMKYLMEKIKLPNAQGTENEYCTYNPCRDEILVWKAALCQQRSPMISVHAVKIMKLSGTTHQSFIFVQRI